MIFLWLLSLPLYFIPVCKTSNNCCFLLFWCSSVEILITFNTDKCFLNMLLAFRLRLSLFFFCFCVWHPCHHKASVPTFFFFFWEKRLSPFKQGFLKLNIINDKKQNELQGTFQIFFNSFLFNMGFFIYQKRSFQRSKLFILFSGNLCEFSKCNHISPKIYSGALDWVI